MKILTGALLAVVLALGLTGWRLQTVSERLAVEKTQSAALAGELERQVQAGQKLHDRLALLDQSLSRLHETQTAHTRQLGLTLAGIDRIEKSEGDSHESVECLDLRVPSELDGWLR